MERESTPEARPSSAKTKKAERTKVAIVEAALCLFREHGYEGTTMRAVADEAGVALGSAYYYFKSKEDLVQGFYGRTHDEHLVACADLLAVETEFSSRLRGVMRAKLETIAPYHQFAGVLFRTAADPRSPLNPFSPESEPVRCEATRLFAEVVEGSTQKVAKPLVDVLPGLLWMYHMGIILFWIHDSSDGAEKTSRFMERTVDLVIQLVKLARNPVFRPALNSVLGVIQAAGGGIDRSAKSTGTAGPGGGAEAGRTA